MCFLETPRMAGEVLASVFLAAVEEALKGGFGAQPCFHPSAPPGTPATYDGCHLHSDLLTWGTWMLRQQGPRTSQFLSDAGNEVPSSCWSPQCRGQQRCRAGVAAPRHTHTHTHHTPHTHTPHTTHTHTHTLPCTYVPPLAWWLNRQWEPAWQDMTAPAAVALI